MNHLDDCEICQIADLKRQLAERDAEIERLRRWCNVLPHSLINGTTCTPGCPKCAYDRQASELAPPAGGQDTPRPSPEQHAEGCDLGEPCEKCDEPLPDKADERDHHVSCPEYGLKDVADVFCNCGYYDTPKSEDSDEVSD